MRKEETQQSNLEDCASAPPSSPLNATFSDWDSARSFVLDQGFDYWKGVPVNMGEGLEHIIAYDYPCSTSLSRFCRVVDLRFESRKPKPGKTLPELIGFIQVSLGRRNK